MYESLYANKDAIRFHTPAHNGLLCENLTQLDVTELPYSGNLLESSGGPRALEDKLAEIYNVKRVLISTNGATNCILTALWALRPRGGIFILGNAHVSVYNAAFLTGNKVFDGDDATETQLIKNNIKTVVVTSPDYFGKVQPLDKIKALCDKVGAVLVVDSAHGSHFFLDDIFPVQASEYADLVIYSLHKTLPVATGGAILAINNNEFITPAEDARKIFHSTSPSYITMASMDLAFSDIPSLKEGYIKAVKKVNELKEKGIEGFTFEPADDPARPVISSRFWADDVYNYLAKKNIYLEMAYENKLVAIVTPYNYGKLGILFDELRNMRLEAPRYIPTEKTKRPFSQAGVSESYRKVTLENALGLRCCRPFGIYPPGTPVCRESEIITSEHIEIMQKHIGRTFGIESGCVCVVL